MSNTISRKLVPTLSELVLCLGTAKAREELARAERIKVEEQIAILVPGPDEGSKTVKLEDGTKVTVERGFNYKPDISALEKVFDNADDTDGRRFVPLKTKTTRELDLPGYRWFRDNDPEGFAMLAQHVVATPKKVSVTLKVK